MARKINVVVESDLSGSTNADTVEFGWGGKTYEVDLTDKEKADFEKSLKKYLEVARLAKKSDAPASRSAGRRSSKAERTGPSPAAIRVWAAENDIEVPARGRIPETLIAQYTEANPGV